MELDCVTCTLGLQDAPSPWEREPLAWLPSCFACPCSIPLLCPLAAVYLASAETLSLRHGIQRCGRYYTSKFHSSSSVLRLMAPLSPKQDLDYSQSLSFLLRLFPLPVNFSLYPLSNPTRSCSSSNVPGLPFRCAASQ